MSKEHRLSLYAFALVAIACAVIVVTGLRSDALRGLLTRQGGDVVAGRVLTHFLEHRALPGRQEPTAITPGPAATQGAVRAAQVPAEPAAHSGSAHRPGPRGALHAPGLGLGEVKTHGRVSPADLDAVTRALRLGQVRTHGRDRGRLGVDPPGSTPVPGVTREVSR